MPEPRPTYAAKSLRVVDSVAPKSDGFATVLQLSDLHLLARTPLADPSAGRGFLPDLKRALTEEMEERGTEFDLVVVTGDLIDASELLPWRWCKAMARARKAILEVCRHVGVNPTRRLLVIPGNHDLKWRGLIPLPGFRRQFRKHFGKYFVHSYYPRLGLLVGCFDSNIPVRLWGLLDSAKGLAPVEQCRFVREDKKGLDLTADGRADMERAFHLALIHHHLMPIPADDGVTATRLVGSPSQMLLRNAGSFLQELLQDDYRLVLHGHLHTHGYWLPQTFLDGEEEETRWLELISCGWAGVASPHAPGLWRRWRPGWISRRKAKGGEAAKAGGKGAEAAACGRVFNVVRIQPAGPIEATRVQFGNGGRTIPKKQEMAGYNLVRTRAWDRWRRSVKPVLCDMESQRWDVILPSGDVVLSRLLKGLRGDGEAVGEMVIYMAAAGLTNVRFSATRLGREAVAVPCEQFVVPASDPGDDPRPGVSEVGYRLKFDPPLAGDERGKIDLLLHIISFGAMSSSREDQEHTGILEGQTPGKEEIRYEAGRAHGDGGAARACKRAALNLRFFSESPDDVPPALDVRVYDPRSIPAPLEAGSDHLTWDFWSSDREPGDDLLGIRSIPEASLSVYRPQVGYSYGLEWDLPDLEPVLDREALIDQREKLLALRGSRRAVEAAEEFVRSVRAFVEGASPDAGAEFEWQDPSLGLGLYAFDAANHRMVRICGEGEPLPEMVAYGRDLIGTAFRSRFGASFDRDATPAGGHPPLFDRIRPDVRCLYAWPLWRSEPAPPAEGEGMPSARMPLDLAPVGVLALASRIPRSGLSHHVQTDGLARPIIESWRACQAKAGWAD